MKLYYVLISNRWLSKNDIGKPQAHISQSCPFRKYKSKCTCTETNFIILNESILDSTIGLKEKSPVVLKYTSVCSRQCILLLIPDDCWNAYKIAQNTDMSGLDLPTCLSLLIKRARFFNRTVLYQMLLFNI